MKEGWEYKTLGEVCKIYNGNSINADYKKKHFLGATGGLPFIATKDVSPLGTIDYNNGVRIPNYEEYKVAPANSVFICAEGGSAGKKFAYVEKDVCFGNKLFCITPKDKAIKGKFIYHFVQSDNFRGQLFSLLTGLIGGVSAKKFQTIEIPVPSLSEQQSIVDYLDSAFAKIDAMKANAEKALNEAKALFQASLKEMLEPKEGWDSIKLGDFAYMKAGDFVKASDIYQNYAEGLYPCYGGNGFRGYVNEPNQEGDFCLIGRQGALCGCVNRAKGIFRTTEHAVIVKPYQDIPTSLVYYMLINLNLNKYATGAAQPGLSVKNIAEQVIIRVPPRNAHFTIAATLDSLKSKVDRLQENYDKISQECDALKQAILRQVFE